jgi:hypothetical protein
VPRMAVERGLASRIDVQPILLLPASYDGGALHSSK